MNLGPVSFTANASRQNFNVGKEEVISWTGKGERKRENFFWIVGEKSFVDTLTVDVSRFLFPSSCT